MKAVSCSKERFMAKDCGPQVGNICRIQLMVLLIPVLFGNPCEVYAKRNVCFSPTHYFYLSRHFEISFQIDFTNKRNLFLFQKIELIKTLTSNSIVRITQDKLKELA